MERIVVSNASRLDVWGVYVDMETHTLKTAIAAAAAPKAGHQAPQPGDLRTQKDRVRAVFERGAAAARKPRQIQSWFLRWFDWESAYGSEATAAGVRDRVAKLLAATTASAAAASTAAGSAPVAL